MWREAPARGEFHVLRPLHNRDLKPADTMESQLELQIVEESWEGPTDDRPTLWPGIWEPETDEKTSGFATTPPSTNSTNSSTMSDSFYDCDTTCWSTESYDDEDLFFKDAVCKSTDDKLQLLDDHCPHPPEYKTGDTAPTTAVISRTGDSQLDTRPMQTTSGSRKRTAKDAGLTAKVTPINAGELCWKSLIKLLSDDSFLPGARPDEIKDKTVGENVMFKEIPKRRRPHSTANHPRDKWYNTGGIKSASDRFDAEIGLGLRKRYGKVVRGAGLSVLRFYEYTLLHRDPKTGEVDERKDGPTLMHLVPDLKRPKTGDHDGSVSPLEQRVLNQEKKISE
eukprot:COSAG02_NODE_7146_length_3157_cov_29.464373_1_plen_336_part_10